MEAYLLSCEDINNLASAFQSISDTFVKLLTFFIGAYWFFEKKNVLW